MINLLPPEEKRQLRAARTNTLLIRYNVLFLASMAFIGLAVAITYFYLTTTKAGAERVISENNAKVSSYSAVEAQAQLFRNNLGVAKQILDREVTYTKVILDISRLLPRGVVLESLDLDAQTFGTPTTLTGRAKDYNAALAFKDSFQKSSLFSDVHFQSIAADDSGSVAGYPITVNLNVTIKKDVAK